MKKEMCLIMIGLSLAAVVRAEDAPAVAPVAVEPSAPALVEPVVPAPVPVPVPDREETKMLQGTIEVQNKANGSVVRVFIDSNTGKRMVLPSDARTLPPGFTWGTYTGEVSINAAMLYRMRDGKEQVIIKRIFQLTDLSAAPAEVAPEVTPVESTPAESAPAMPEESKTQDAGETAL